MCPNIPKLSEPTSQPRSQRGAERAVVAVYAEDDVGVAVGVTDLLGGEEGLDHATFAKIELFGPRLFGGRFGS